MTGAGESGHWGLVLERVKGIEPSFSAWEADVLPLNDTRSDYRFYNVIVAIE